MLVLAAEPITFLQDPVSLRLLLRIGCHCLRLFLLPYLPTHTFSPTMLSLLGTSRSLTTASRRFPSTTTAPRPTVSPTERLALRQARKERATQVLQAQQGGSSSAGSSNKRTLQFSRWVWYLSVGLPTGLLVWGLNEKDSPPAQLAHAIGLTDFVQQYTDQVAKPAHEKLLPDWSQVRVCVRVAGLNQSYIIL